MKCIFYFTGFAVFAFLFGSSLNAECPNDLSHEKLQAILWMQRSAEYKANTMQAYALATANLDQALSAPDKWPEAFKVVSPSADRKPAIIIDVDETILDNTPADTMLIANDRRKFDKANWDAWELRANAHPIDGALAFVNHAVSKGVTVFYVTNRSNEQKLRENLKTINFPVAASPDVVLLAGECSSSSNAAPWDKECRRQDIAKNYRVLLLIGDDFSDFVPLTGKSADERIQIARDSADHWGRDWIILPNPNYGSWERAFFDPATDDGDVILKKKIIALEGPN